MSDIDRIIEDLRTTIETLEKTIGLAKRTDIKEEHLSVLGQANEMLRKVQTNMWGEETARKLTNGAEDPIPVPKPLELKTNPTSPDSE